LNSSDSVDAKLRIAKAAALDTKSLTTEAGTRVLLGRVLQETTAEVSQYLEIGGRNPGRLFQLFSEFQATLDPRTFWHYDTNGNAFVINLLSLLYTPAWRLASAFVHEAEHVSFLKKRGMVNAPESEQDEFAEKFRREMEIRASNAELRFLLAIRRHVPSETRTYLSLTKYRVHDFDRVISHVVNRVRALKTNRGTQARRYKDAGEEHALREHAKIASVLGIELPKPNSDGNYEKVRVEFGGQ
jgi:hypothetical protein